MDFEIDVTSPVGHVRTTNAGELADAIARRIHACDPDGMPDDFLNYAPGFIRWAIEAAVLAERAACAKIAQDLAPGWECNHGGSHADVLDDSISSPECIAAEILARCAAQDPTPGEGRER